MTPPETKPNIIRLTISLLVSTALAAALFYACYQYDNKYTAPGPQALLGVLLLDEETLTRYPVVHLVRDWEIYRGKLLTPENFHESPPAPDELVYIGQYGGFEGPDAQRAPHGSATYRLNIFLPSETRSYTLELPEIYSAYKLYMNGVLAAQMGDPSPDSYSPQTGNRAVTVQTANRLEILIAVSDYSYIYSGMVYPPAFGEPTAVASILSLRLVVRTLAGAFALCIGLLYLCLWLLTRREKAAAPLLYAALCFCFVLYTCYPVIKTLLPADLGWYYVENIAYSAMFLLVMLIQRPLTVVPVKWFRPFAVFSAFVCCCALIMPFIIGSSLTFMMAYSTMVELCAWICAGYLTFGAAYGVLRGAARSAVMLVGIAVFDAALIMDKLFPLFEPVFFGWFNELAGGLLVTLTGYVMAMDIAKTIRLRRAMENRIENISKMLEVQRTFFPAILRKEEETRAARHDLRHHMSMIRQLNAQGDGKLEAYLDSLASRPAYAEQTVYCKHHVINMLLWMYDSLARAQDTDIIVRASLPLDLPISDADLCVVLSNLLENALEASAKLPAEQRSVSVSIGIALEQLGILVTNKFDGSFSVQNKRYLSSKREGREGVGLYSVEAVCKSYGGSASFYTHGKSFRSEVILPMAINRR